MRYPKQLLAKYRVGKTLGRGAYGKVKLIQKLANEQPRALKVMNKSSALSVWQKELDVLALLKHPNIVKYYEHYESKRGVFIVLELCSGGDLLSHIMAVECLPEARAKTLTAQLLSALEYCHGNLLTHRDIKPENLLLDAAGNLKLADFGFAKRINATGRTSTVLGSTFYAAIELFSGGPTYDPFLADCWSAGVVIAVMVIGGFPFSKREASNENLLKETYERGRRPRLSMERTLKGDQTSPEFRDLIRCLLEPDPALRLRLDKVKRHPWLNGYLVDSRLPARSAVPAALIDAELLETVCNITSTDRQSLVEILSQGQTDSLDFSIYHLLLERQDEMLRPHQVTVEDRTLSGTELMKRVYLDAPDTPPALLRKRIYQKKIRISII
jgi:serine/threonine protein kinase